MIKHILGILKLFFVTILHFTSQREKDRENQLKWKNMPEQDLSQQLA